MNLLYRRRELLRKKSTPTPTAVRSALYPDGTLMLNETPDVIAQHETWYGGQAIATYPPLDADNPYVFAAASERPWHNERNSIAFVRAYDAEVPATSMDYWFDGCAQLRYHVLEKVTFNTVTSMRNCFNGCSNLDCTSEVRWDTSNVTNMRNMFANTGYNTTQIPGIYEPGIIKDFDTSNVELIGNMFARCSSLEKLDLSHFDLSKVTGIVGCFTYDANLRELILGSPTTTYMSSINSGNLFSNCSSLESLTINGTNVLPLSNANALNNLKVDCQILVPASLVNAYKADSVWGARAVYISAI